MSDSSNSNNKRSRGLGQGLGALIPDEPEGEDKDGFIECEIDEIEAATKQPRKQFDESSLEQLASSIEQNGLIQPLLVRKKNQGGGYQLIAGERRWRASQKAGLQTVPVVVRDVTKAEAYALGLIENIQREDLNPIEQARAYEQLLDEFEFTQSQLAEKLGKSRSSIANELRLLTLPGGVQKMLEDGKLTSGHARALVPLSEQKATVLAKRIVRQGLSVRQTEQLVKQIDEDTSTESSAERDSDSKYRDDPHTRDIKNKLQKSLGTKVRLKDRHGEGKVEIYYDDYEILQSVLDRILES